MGSPARSKVKRFFSRDKLHGSSNNETQTAVDESLLGSVENSLEPTHGGDSIQSDSIPNRVESFEYPSISMEGGSSTSQVTPAQHSLSGTAQSSVAGVITVPTSISGWSEKEQAERYHATYERPQLGSSSGITRGDHRSDATSDDPHRTWTSYLCHLVSNRKGGASTESGLIWAEIMQIINLVTDAFLVIKLFIATTTGMDSMYNNSIALTLLASTHVVSVMCYVSRGKVIYHRIEEKWNILFVPGMAIKTIRKCAAEDEHETLLMYDRLNFTYTLLMRILEDIPQVLLVLTYLSDRADLFIILSLALSILNMVQSTCRLGYLYPWANTMALLISRAPPVDSKPGALIAAPTTGNLPVLLCSVSNVFSIAYLLCMFQVSGYRKYYYSFVSSLLALVGLICGWYALYLRKEYRSYIKGTATESGHEISLATIRQV